MSALQRETLAFRNPNKEWVVKELDALICEWRGWQKEVEKLGEDPHNRFDPKPGRILADGEENIQKHKILRAKTLEFLENNIAGHGFISGRDGTHVDRTDLRLKFRVKHRLDELDELRACLEYAGDTTVKEKMIGSTIGVLRNPPPVKTTQVGPAINASIQTGYAFVAMPIDSDDDQLVDVLEAIKTAAADCGISAERVDEVESNQRITDRILQSITKAEFVIVDLTKERPNVFFEAGFAHGLGKVPRARPLTTSWRRSDG